jgi:trk system potassium uptake protein TrkH
VYDDKLTALRDSIFMVVSLHTSTGFGLADYELWSPNAQFVLLITMLIGGMAGSTSGGLKVVRIYLVLKYIAGEFTRLLHPQAVSPTRMQGVTVPRTVVSDVLGYVSLYFVAVVLATFLVTLAGMDWISGLSAVVSSFGGVGPGMGDVGPFDNYAWLTPFDKWVLMACMVLGRLEFFGLLILFSPAYWRR